MKNPDCVALPLQILTNVVPGKGHNSRYVLSQNPRRSNFSDQPRKFRPEISVVVFPFLASCKREGLTGKTAVDDVHCSNFFTSHCLYVVINRNVGPVSIEYQSAE
jgi:hypothetical protein